VHIHHSNNNHEVKCKHAAGVDVTPTVIHPPILICRSLQQEIVHINSTCSSFLMFNLWKMDRFLCRRNLWLPYCICENCVRISFRTCCNRLVLHLHDVAIEKIINCRYRNYDCTVHIIRIIMR
jgi:hypothetical protein